MAFNYYILSNITSSGIISKRYLYLSGNDKTYDSQRVATVTISNLVGPDNVYYQANFDNKNAGSNKVIFVTISGLSQSNNNYQLYNSITSANIYQKLIKATYTSLTKTYNALTSGNSTYTISGIFPDDIVDISNIYTTNFDNIYVGNNKLVYINNINLIGTDYFNYVISISDIINGTIVTAKITPYFTINKYYDKTQSAPITYTLSGIYDIDINFISCEKWLSGDNSSQYSRVPIRTAKRRLIAYAFGT
jgi:hypothetical protein